MKLLQRQKGFFSVKMKDDGTISEDYESLVPSH